MSKKNTMMVTCPKCGKENKVVVYDSINVTIDPDGRDLLFSNKINTFSCYSCNTEVSISKDLMFNDMEKKVMIQYEPQISREEMVKRVEELNKQAEVLNKIKNINYTYRYTANWDEFLEKIRIFSDGFNDIPIEFIKAVMKSDYEKKNKVKVHSIRFLEAKNNKLTQSVFELIVGHDQREIVIEDISLHYHTIDIKFGKLEYNKFMIVNEDFFNWILEGSIEYESNNKKLIKCNNCGKMIIPTFHNLCPNCDADLNS